MRLPTVEGTIRRRLLLNFRIDPEVMARQLPEVFAPKLHKGYAVAGICLIRLEAIRPLGFPRVVGLSSENAAHRMAVVWHADGARREGVFIPRRDTDSLVSQLAGGRAFPGEHHAADFDITETKDSVELHMKAKDGTVVVNVTASVAANLPASSCFSSLDEASAFFEPGSLGYSATRDPTKLHGVALQTHSWRVEPLKVEVIHSSFFSDETRFPMGSVAFDHGLIMRNIDHEWHARPDLDLTS